MCGRFTLRAPASVIAEQFALFEMAPFTPRFNIAPTQPVAIVRAAIPAASGLSRGSAQSDRQPPGSRRLTWVRWGLVPGWAKDLSVGNRMINARAESVAEKPAYRGAFQRRRCLMLADGFYEWQKTGRAKQPHFFRLKGDRPFAFAALWESWQDPQGEAIESAVLLTTEANAVVAPVHDRMPVILEPAYYDRWLDGAALSAEESAPMLRPHAAEAMEAYAVSLAVNSPTHDDPRCIEPLSASPS